MNNEPFRAPVKGVVTLKQMLSAIQEGDYQQLKNLLTRFNMGRFPPHRQDVHIWNFLNEALTHRYPLVVKLLLTKFQKVNFPASVGKPLIVTAAQQGNIEIIETLAEFGADLNINYNKTTPLFEALTLGLKRVVECLLQKGANPNFRGECSQTPLHFAVQQGNLDLVLLLQENGADLNTSDTFKQTPLHFAVEGGNLEMVKFMVEKGAKVNIKGKSNQTPLHLAVKSGNFEVVKLLVEKGADVNIQDESDQTSLYFAIECGNFEIAKFLVEKGAGVNVQGKSNDQTPLHLAAEQGNLELFKFMLEKGGDLNISNRSGESLLHVAVRNKNLELVKLIILEKCPLVNAQDNSNETPFHLAVRKGNLELVKFLLEQGANLEAKNTYGERPLHMAASGKHQEIANYLLEKGACVNGSDNEQETPLFDAIEANSIEILKLLISKGADINVQSSSNENLLHCASNSKPEILKYLLQMGLDVNLSNNENRTPLFYAAEQNLLENVQLLLQHGAQLSTEDKEHQDLFELAFKSKPKILKLILDYHPHLYLRGADIDCVNESWEEEGEKREIQHLENIVLLAEHGLDPNIEITYQSARATLLFLAIDKSHDLVVRLLEAGANVNLKSKYTNEDYYYYRHNKRWCFDDYDDSEYSPLFAVILAEANDDYEFHCGSKIVTTLLQYGANFNDFPQEFDDKFSQEYYVTLDGNLREFIRHIALMNDQGLEVNERILDRIEAEFSEFFGDCKREIEKLKMEKFSGTASSFFEVLTKNAKQLAEFVRNKSVIDEFEAHEKYKKRFPGFPIYGSAITLQLEMGLRRRKLLDKAAQNCYTVFPCLPRSVSEEIFSHLENRDVRVLINACQPSRSRPRVSSLS